MTRRNILIKALLFCFAVLLCPFLADRVLATESPYHYEILPIQDSEENISWETDEHGYTYYTKEVQGSLYRFYRIQGYELEVYDFEHTSRDGVTTSNRVLTKVTLVDASEPTFILPNDLGVNLIEDYAFSDSGITELRLYGSYYLNPDAFTNSAIKRLYLSDPESGVGCFLTDDWLSIVETTLPAVEYVYCDAENGIFSVDGVHFLLHNQELSVLSVEEKAGGNIVIPSEFKPTDLASLGKSEKIRSFKIPESITSISSGAFQGTSIKTLSIPDSVDFIGENAFEDCPKLATINYKDSGKILRKASQFGNCTATVIYNKKAKSFCVDGVRYTIENNVLTSYYVQDSCKGTMKIPDGVKKMDSMNYWDLGNTDLVKKLILPDSLKDLLQTPFYFSNLTTVTMPKEPTKLECNIFKNCGSLKTIYIPEANDIYTNELWLLSSKATIIVQSGSLENFYLFEMYGVCAVTDSTKVSINIKELTMLPGDKQRIFLANTRGYNKGIKSSKKSVAYFNENGELIAKKPGTTVVSIKYKGKTYQCKVTVLKPTIENRVKQLEKQYHLKERSDYHIARICFEWMRYQCAYDDNLKKYHKQHILLEHEGVCNAYTEATSYLMRYYNIPVVSCSSKSMNHIWNMVKIGNRWYHTDATWADFLKTEKQIRAHGHFGFKAMYKSTSTKIDKEYRSKR